MHDRADATSRALGMLPWIAFLACIATVLLLQDGYVTTVAMMMVLWALLACGLNFIMGHAGYYHLGLGAFYGIGAYGSALITLRFGYPMVVGLVVMPLVASAVSAAIGPLILRTKGLHFAVATLALGMIVSDVTNNWVSVTGGPIGVAGIQRPGPLTIGGVTLDLGGTGGMFAIGCAVLTAVMVACAAAQRSPFVLTLRAIKSDDVFSQSLGYHTTPYKVAAFALAGGIAASAGVLYAHFVQYISPEPFTFFSASFQAFVVLALGGPGTVWGPVLGSVVLTLIPEVLDVDPVVRLVIYGMVLLGVMVAMPQGLAPGLASAVARLRRRAPADAAPSTPPTAPASDRLGDKPGARSLP
jgi:branched-chain amino acid transport system permease protein